MLVAGMSGCAANQSHANAKKGALMGALGGAVVGLMKDGVRGAVVGAAVGGAIGATVGAAIDYNKYKQAGQVYDEYGMKSKKVAIEDLELSKGVYKGGENGSVDIKFAVVNPDPKIKNKVNTSIVYYKGNKQLMEKSDEQTLKTGGYAATFPLEIPKGADEGEYRVEAKVSAFGKTAKMRKPFRVFYAKNEAGKLILASVTPY
jgi:hypothetical protein